MRDALALGRLAAPTVAQTQAALSNLGDGFAGMGETLLASPGVTPDHLLCFADALAAGATELRELFPGGTAESRDMDSLASILRDAAPRYTHPPRLPASAAVADWTQRRAPGFGR